MKNRLLLIPIAIAFLLAACAGPQGDQGERGAACSKNLEYRVNALTIEVEALRAMILKKEKDHDNH